MRIHNDKAVRIMLLLQQAGARDVLVVGGYVRDLFLNIESKDIDIEVYGLDYDQIVRALQPHFKVDVVGKAFGVVKIDNEIDVSVPRRESKIGVGHRGFNAQPDPDMSVREAARRRDFTINSMALGLDGLVRDHFGGKDDLFNGTLRATSDAFSEDPLRVMRAMQFAARFNMWLDPKTVRMAQALAAEFHTLPKERLWEEWKKWALKSQKPSRGLRLLLDVGWLGFFPEIMSMVDVKQDPEWHPEGDVFIHTGHVVDAAAKIADREQLDENDRLVLMFAALGHDFGKVNTTAFVDGRWRARGHCEASAELIDSFMERIGAPHFIAEHAKPLAVEHLIHAGVQPTPRIIRRLANRLAPASIDMLSMVIEADHSGRPPLPVGNPFTAFVEMASELEVVDDQPQPILLGRHLIEMGVEPGPDMGRVLKQAFEAQLDGAFSNLDGAREWARGIL